MLDLLCKGAERNQHNRSVSELPSSPLYIVSLEYSQALQKDYPHHFVMQLHRQNVNYFEEINFTA